MDNIRQYQRLSDIKPSYQKLTKPYYSVNRFKIERNVIELDLFLKQRGLWETKRGGNENNKKIIIWNISDLLEI
jgi:hypothetical protein